MKIHAHPQQGEIWKAVKHHELQTAVAWCPELVAGRDRESILRGLVLHRDNRAALERIFGPPVGHFKGLKVWVLQWGQNAAVIFSGRDKGTSYECLPSEFPGMSERLLNEGGALAPPGWERFVVGIAERLESVEPAPDVGLGRGGASRNRPRPGK